MSECTRFIQNLFTRPAFIALALAVFSIIPTASAQAETRAALFAGGCFWCMEPVFDVIPGVTDTKVGYTGGKKNTANYEQVSTGTTGHIESIKVIYDPAKVTYKQLVDAFWEGIDPFDEQGQFADKGKQYHTYIFVHDDKERSIAEASKKEIQKRFKNKTVATQIVAATPFFAAEDYHQDYYKKNSIHYNFYKYGSGRLDGLKQIWGKKDKVHDAKKDADILNKTK